MSATRALGVAVEVMAALGVELQQVAQPEALVGERVPDRVRERRALLGERDPIGHRQSVARWIVGGRRRLVERRGHQARDVGARRQQAEALPQARARHGLGSDRGGDRLVSLGARLFARDEPALESAARRDLAQSPHLDEEAVRHDAQVAVRHGRRGHGDRGEGHRRQRVRGGASHARQFEVNTLPVQ